MRTPRFGLAVLGAVLCMLAGAAPAGAAVHRRQTATRLTSGVSVWRQRFTSAGAPERAVLMQVGLSRTVSLNSASPGEIVGATRQDAAVQADATHAIGGINGDWFDMYTTTAVPRGGFIRSGHLLKTPRPGWQANLYLRQDGSAAIGQIPFTATVTRKARNSTSPASSTRLWSVNTVADAVHGRITLVTPDLAGVHLGRSCTVADGRTGNRGRIITQVRTGVRALARESADHWALVSCGGNGAQWLRAQLRVNDRVSVTTVFPQGEPKVAVGGGRVLVERGRAYNDIGGQRLQGRNPETFACVSRTGQSILFGVVDGRSRVSAGVTQPQLQAYLLSLHCWSAMTFDGGGSSTIVARMPGHTRVSVLNVPSDGAPRPVADGLFVYKR